MRIKAQEGALMRIKALQLTSAWSVRAYEEWAVRKAATVDTLNEKGGHHVQVDGNGQE